MPNLFATYGTLRLEGAMQDTPVLKNARRRGQCIIPGQLYQAGGYPALKWGQGRTIGDLIELPWLFDFTVFDVYEDYFPAKPRECRYLRRRVRLIEPDVEAWVYYYVWPLDENATVRQGCWLTALDAGVRTRRLRTDRLPAHKYGPRSRRTFRWVQSNVLAPPTRRLVE